MTLIACRECGHQISDLAVACPHCGAPTAASPPTTSAKEQPKEEVTLLDNYNILVTSARIVHAGQTFAMAGVTSVRIHTIVPSHTFQLLLVLGGGLLLLVGFQESPIGWAYVVVGAIMAGAGALAWNTVPTTYQIIVVTSGGERPAYSTSSAETSLKIKEAINAAIVARG